MYSLLFLLAAITRVSNALEGFDAGCLASHNQYRAKHGAPPLMWSESLAAAAQKWADSLARENIMEHDPSNKDQGENLAHFTNPRPRCKGEKKTECVHCSEMVDDWYNEVKDYDFNTGESKNGGAILHFTQVVWKETRELGMATAVGRKYGFITVGRYSPRGNMGYAEDFKKNVLPTGSQPPQPPPSSTLTPQTPTTSSSGGPLPRPAQVSNTLNFFDANCLASHNQYRAKHGAPPLIWSESLAAGAQKWADYLAENSLMKHDLDTINKEQVGENLAWFKPPRDKCMSTISTDCVNCSEMVADWYNEVKDYDFTTGKGKRPNAVILHFTQVVWKDTKELGVATSISKSNKFITVARYSPRGNMGNEEDFRKNVLPEGSLPAPITSAQTSSPSTGKQRPTPGSLPPPITLAQTLSPSTRRPFPRPQGKLPPPITLAQTLSPSTRRPFPRPQGEKCEYLIVTTANKQKKIIEMCKGKRNQTYVPEETTRPTTVLTTPAPTTAPPSKTEASTSASTAATTAAATTTSSTTATTAATTAAPTTTATTATTAAATTAATTEATTAPAPTTSASTAATTTAATTAATTSSATTEATTAAAPLSNPSPTVPTTSMEQAGQAPTEEPQLMDQQHKAVVLVNLYRAMHGAHPLIPSTRLTQEAQSWAEQLAKTGQLSHDSSTTDGENIAMVKAGGQDVTRAIDYWYDEEKQYDFNKRDFSKATGHFTQLVWKSTQEIGIGIAPSKDNSQYYIVARFRPPGNIKGRFETNVAREKVIR